MPRVRRHAVSPSTSSSSSNSNVSVVHLSVAKKLAAGRSYTGVPPLGPLVLPPYISYDIVDDSPGLPLKTKPDELYATVGGSGEPSLKKIKLIADCEEGEKWKEAAERFQSGNKQGTIPAAYIKMEEDDQYIKKLKRYGSLRGTVMNSNETKKMKTNNDSNETKKMKTNNVSNEIKKRKTNNDSNGTKRRIKKNPPAVSNVLPPDFVLPDLTPEEVQTRREEATLKNEALKRGLGLKSLSFHHAEMVDKQTQTHTQAVLTVPRKIVEFTERLVAFLRILRKAIEVLPESHLLQIEAYFEVDWMVEDIEIAIRGAISRQNLIDGTRRGCKGLTVADRLPFSKNQKIVEFAERLMSLAKTLYQAIEMLSEPNLVDIERLFDVDWMIEDIGRIVEGVISCKKVHDRSG